MGRDDWYRNTFWSPVISSEFEAKLQRARKKAQYLNIQAGVLAKSEPTVALELLERYFEEDDEFFQAPAHVNRASALLTLGRLADAVAAYEAALAHEHKFASVRTRAFLELPYLIATHGITARFEQAIQLLDSSWDQLVFPIDRFMANATLAIISDSAPDGAKAAESYARSALQASTAELSGLPYHPDVGLVDGGEAAVIATLNRIVEGDPS